MSHTPIKVLFVILALIFVCPDIVVVLVDLIELLDDFTWTNLDYLLSFVSVISSPLLAFLALAFLRFFFLRFLAFALRFFLIFVLLSIRLLLYYHTIVETFDIFGGLAILKKFLLLDPIATLLQHAFLDLVLFHVIDLLLNIFFSINIFVHVGLLDLLSLDHYLVHLGDWLLLRFSGHAQEHHLFLSHFVYPLPCQDSFYVSLYEHGSLTFFFRFCGFTLVASLLGAIVNLKFFKIATDHQLHTFSTLSTTLVLLNKSDSIMNIVKLHHQWFCDNFFNWYKSIMRVFDSFVNGHILLFEVLLRFLLFIVIPTLFLLLLALLFLLFLLSATLLDHRLLEFNVYGYAVELFEVARHWYLNDGWVVLQVEEQLVEMHKHGGRSWIEQNQILFDLTDPTYSRLEYPLDEDALLRLYHLVIAFL